MDMFGELPISVEIGGEVYPINTDFRIGIKAESVLTSESLTEELKVIEMIKLYFPKQPPIDYLKETINAIIWFYTGKESDNVSTIKKDHDNTKERHFSFEYDSSLVFSAFYQQYGIDLSESHMHWWKFKSMFSSLSEETQLVKVIQYRAAKITSKMPKETADHYKKMKKLYALPQVKNEERKIEFVSNALMRGESLEGITQRYYEMYGVD